MRSAFSFAIITDSHVDVREERSDGYWWHKSLYPRSVEILQAAVREINARGPDFVVHCGDLTNASDEASFRAGAGIMNGLEMPWYFVPGNHDTYERGARRLAADLCGLDDGRFYRVERVGNWRLLFLDSCYWRCKDGVIREQFLPDQYVNIAAPEAELAWVRSEFEQDGGTPTLCFTHAVMAVRKAYDVSRMPGGKEVEKSPVQLKQSVGCVELGELLGNQRCVKAVFYGHGGWHDCILREGTLFCQTAELVQYPVEMRWVEVFPDRIETEVFGLPNEDFAQQSYVKEWGNDWSAGREVDRCMTHRF